MGKERILTTAFVFCFISYFCNSVTFYMPLTISAEYAADFGAEGTLQGLASGIFVLGVLIMRFLFSRILAKIGWKKMIFIFQPLHIASCFMYFLISDLTTLFIVRFLHGLFYGLASSSVLANGTYHLPKSRYGEANGYLMTGITLAIAVGPFTAGIVYDSLGAAGCFTATAITGVMMWVFLCLTGTDYSKIDVTGKTTEDEQTKGLDKYIEISVIPITICVFISAFSYSSVLSFIRRYGQIMSLESVVSIFFIVYAAVLVLSRPLAGKIQDKKGDHVVIVFCIIVQFISHLSLGLMPDTAGVIIAAVTCAVGYGSASSCMSSIVSRGVPMSRKSNAVNTYWIGNDLANGIGPIVLGTVLSAIGVCNMYIAAAFVSILVIPLYRAICWNRYKE